MIRKICVVLVGIFLKCVFHIDAVGVENVPSDTGAILALNHRSNWDVVVAAETCPRTLRFMAKSELFKNRLFGALITGLGAFPVKRGKGDIGAIKSSVSILKSNNVMLIFPEGRRSNDDLGRAKSGVVLISQMAEAPIIPTYISGEYKFRGKITITYGEPIRISREKKLTGEEMQAVADDVMKKIRSYKVD